MLTGLLDGSRSQHRQHRRDLATITEHWAALETLDDTDLDRHIADARTAGVSRHQRLAIAAETIRRTLGLRLHPNQLAGALALAGRQVVELATGEGKTVMIVPFVFDAVCDGRSIHVATANTYLAGRDAAWMAPAYRRLGVTVGHLSETTEAADAGEQLRTDVCYSTVPVLAVAWLRDQLSGHLEHQRWRQADVCVVDEADAVLLDLVRAPIAITRTVAADHDQTLRYHQLAAALIQADEDGENGDWGVDEALGVAALLEPGIDKLEAELGVTLYDGTHSETIAGVTDALVARALLHPGRDYLVEGGRIRPINPITGRVSTGRFRAGVHSALEAKEQVAVTDEVEQLAQIATGAFLARYDHLCGMTATALSARDELVELYDLDVIALEPHVACRRVDRDDVIVPTAAAKFDAVVTDTTLRHRRGQPVLIGVETTEDLHQIARRLEAAGIAARLLSADNHAEEADVLAAAGQYGAVTVATRMAGRGVDIVLGGADAADRDRVVAAGGLCVIGAQRFDSRRGDDQLRGRSGRQGDPGESRFYVSLEDELLRIHAREALAAVIGRLNKLQGENVGHRQLTRLLDKAQAAKSAQQHALRKSLLAYDTVLGAQRDRFYQARQQLLETADHTRIDRIVADLAGVSDETQDTVPGEGPSLELSLDERRRQALTALDTAWCRHLADCAQLRTGIGLRGIGGRNPLIEYQRETTALLAAHLRDAHAELTGPTA